MVVKKIKTIRGALSKIDPIFTKVFLPWILKHPKSIPTMVKLAKSYKRTRDIREHELENGLKVPPSLIISITSKCNLSCAGCYAAATGTLSNSKCDGSLGFNQWNKIMKEAKELGVFSFIIAGGEPFLLPNLLTLCETYDDRLFLIFTNGTLIKEEQYKRLKKLRNVVIMLSIEGDKFLTDLRRGEGVYDKVFETLKKLKKNGILCGISTTINKNNFRFWMDDTNINTLIEKGVRIAFLLEYIPVDNDTYLMLTSKESKEFRKKVLEFRQIKQLVMLHSPGDEEYLGGCVSAGRSFVHINPFGDLTPCPVSNIATHNVSFTSLREGLASPLFKLIRENEHLLETEDSPCALFAHPEEVDELVKEVKAYRTVV